MVFIIKLKVCFFFYYVCWVLRKKIVLFLRVKWDYNLGDVLYRKILRKLSVVFLRNECRDWDKL